MNLSKEISITTRNSLKPPPPPAIRHNKDITFYMKGRLADRPAGNGVHCVWLTVFGSACAPNIKVLAFSGMFLQQM